jgi:hypothetical protein
MQSPLMYAEASDIRKEARSASSRSSPGRRSGIRSIAASSSDGSGSSRSHAPFVGNGPGAIALQVMPRGPHSTASERVIASTPAFAAADGTTYAEPPSA